MSWKLIRTFFYDATILTAHKPMPKWVNGAMLREGLRLTVLETLTRTGASVLAICYAYLGETENRCCNSKFLSELGKAPTIANAICGPGLHQSQNLSGRALGEKDKKRSEAALAMAI